MTNFKVSTTEIHARLLSLEKLYEQERYTCSESKKKFLEASLHRASMAYQAATVEDKFLLKA